MTVADFARREPALVCGLPPERGDVVAKRRTGLAAGLF